MTTGTPTTHDGFKQTELGLIPADWEVDTIISRCEYADYRGKTPPKSESGTFLVTARNVRRGYIDYDESQEFVPTELYDQIMCRGKPQLGDVLITTEAPLGNVAQIDREDVALAQRIIKYRPRSDSLSCDYLKHFLLSDGFQRLLAGRGSGTTATGIKGSVLHKLSIALPPTLAEQEAIAEALGDADALIESLSALVAKKRHLKQAAMQQLLTGKKRLPGFEGEWEQQPLHLLCTHIVDCPHSTPVWTNDGVVVLRNQNIRDGHLDLSEASYTDEFHFESRTQRATPSHGDLVITREAPMGQVCMIPRSLRCCLGQRMVLLRPDRTKTVPHYLLYVIQSSAVQEQIRIQGGTGSTVSNLRIPVLSKLAIPTPRSQAEQDAIASLLRDIDEEIAGIEAKLAKARQIKQGMMQQLLTGRIRLV